MDGRPPRSPSRITRTGPATAPGATPGTEQPPTEQPLTDVIAADPVGELGQVAVEKFGPRLPFLLKLLAAGAPLSLQVHPDLAQAQQGYADEERRSVPIDAAHRTYKDANHKPELICALTPFDGLCGFRRPIEAAEAMEALGVDSLKPYADLLRAHLEEAALREVLTAILTADPAQMAETVTAAAAAANGSAARTPPTHASPTTSRATRASSRPCC